MGYSIACRPRSPALKKRMLAFMQEHYRSWPILCGDPEGACYAGPPTDDLSYDKAKTAIGIDYGACHGWEREYAFSLVRWMAIRIGVKRRRFTDEGTLKEPVPVFVYDGTDTWPIIVGKAPTPDLRQYEVDTLGIHTFKKSTFVEHEMSAFEPKVYQRALAKVGPCPEKGDRFAWRERLHDALYSIPKVRKSVDHNFALLHNELLRLDLLRHDFFSPACAETCS